MSNIKYGIVPGSIGKHIGLKAGDQIVGVNGKPVVRFEDLTSSKILLDHTILNVRRGSEDLNITIPGTILNEISDQGIDEFIERAPRSKFSIDSVYGNAKKAGLLKGDSITAVNNHPVVFFDQLHDQLDSNKNKQVTLTVVRHNNVMQLPVMVDKDGRIGFARPIKELLPKEDTINYGFFSSLPVGASKAWGTLVDQTKTFGKIFNGQLKARKAISSPIGIAVMFGSHVDWLRFWSLTGLLSMVLAFMNLLPIPALDGGHALFLIIEMIKGKPLSDKFLERAQIVGFVLLITLMVFAFGNDIVKQIMKK
jgi:regulator of sigma E protease